MGLINKSKRQVSISRFLRNTYIKAFMFQTLTYLGQKFNNLHDMLLDLTRSIFDHDTKKLVIYSFIVNIIVFNFFSFHPIFGNHFIRPPVFSPYDQFVAGRWFTFFIFKIFNCNYLPFITPLITILTNILAAILALRIWKKSYNIDFTASLIVVLLITIHPVFLAPFYYPWSSYIYPISILFGVLSVYLTTSSIINLYNFFGASLLSLLAIATYQSSLSIIFTLYFSVLILRLYKFSDYFKEKGFVKYIFLTSSPFFLAGLLYKMSLWILKHQSKDVLSLKEFPLRFLDVLKAIFRSLTMTQPEFSIEIKILLLLIVVFSFALLARKQFKNRRLSVFILLFSLFLISTKFVYLITSVKDFYTYRYNFAQSYFYAFAFFICFANFNRLFKLIGIFILIQFSFSNSLRQDIVRRSEFHDIHLANRILYSLETHPSIDLNKSYTLIRIGRYSNYSRELLKFGPEFKKGGENHMDSGEVTAHWTPASIFYVLGSKVKFKYIGYIPGFSDLISNSVKNVIKQSKPWPSPESIIIREDTIYLILDNPNIK